MEKLALGERQERKKISYKPRLFKNARLSWKLLREGQPASPLAARIIRQCQGTANTTNTLKIHPSKSFQCWPVFSTEQQEMKLSPQRGSFHREIIWFRDQSDFSLLLEDKTILKKRNSALFFTFLHFSVSSLSHSHAHILIANTDLISAAALQLYTETI